MKTKTHTRKYHIQESQEVIPFPAGDHKAARIDKTVTDKYEAQSTKNGPQKKHRLGTVSILNVFDGRPTSLILISDVNQGK